MLHYNLLIIHHKSIINYRLIKDSSDELGHVWRDLILNLIKNPIALVNKIVIFKEY